MLLGSSCLYPWLISEEIGHWDDSDDVLFWYQVTKSYIEIKQNYINFVSFRMEVRKSSHITFHHTSTHYPYFVGTSYTWFSSWMRSNCPSRTNFPTIKRRFTGMAAAWNAGYDLIGWQIDEWTWRFLLGWCHLGTADNYRFIRSLHGADVVHIINWDQRFCDLHQCHDYN